MKNLSSNGYIEFDEYEDAIHSLEELRDQLIKAAGDPRAFKLALIVGCNALNSSLVCALNDTAGVSCLTKKSRIATLEWLEDRRADSNTRRPEQRLEPPLGLVKMALRDRALCAQVDFSLQNMKDIRKAFFMRNRFSHFLPIHWSIEVTGLPRIILSIANVSVQLLRAQGKRHNRILYDEVLTARLSQSSEEIRKLSTQLANDLGEPIERG